MLDTTVQPKPLSPEESTRVALLVEYCGKDFHGSQFQPNRPTVQQALQDALAKLNLQTSAVSFAGRTDAGVNAQGQVAHVDIVPAGLAKVPDLAAALNAMLPASVSVRAAHLDTGAHFNSRRDATHKWYRYVIYNHDYRSAWAAQTGATHVRTPLNADLMRQAARLLLGTHDFKSFQDSDTEITETHCDIRHADVTKDGDFVILDIVANRFLYKMVRNLAGQLMAIGSAEMPQPPEHILNVLAARDRRQAAATAKPEGLTLMAIQYPAPFDFFADDRNVRQLSNSLKHPKMESLQNDENLLRKAS